MPNRDNFHPLVWFVLVTALEAVFLYLVWNHVVAVTFTLPTLTFGGMYMILIGFRILFKELFELANLSILMKNVQDILLFSEQQKAMQFSAATALLVSATAEQAKQGLAKTEK